MDTAGAYYNHLNALLNYPSNAVRRALEAEGKKVDKYVQIGQDFTDGIGWGKVHDIYAYKPKYHDINFDDPKEREQFENTVKTAVGRALATNEPDYELPQAYRDDIWNNLKKYAPMMKNEYYKMMKFWNGLSPQQQDQVRTKVKKFQSTHNKGMIED